jgi:signal peptidase I
MDTFPASSSSTPPADDAAAAGDSVAAGASAPAENRGTASKKRKQQPAPGSIWKELPVLIVIAIALAILLKTFLVQAFYIPSGSMENTLQVGDRVMVNKVVYHLRDIKRGDVVVFDGLDSFTPEVSIPEPTNPVAKALGWFGGLVGFAPPSEKDFIKRVIGIPGDRVACCDAKGRLTVNGVPLNEPYLYPGNAPSDTTFNITVPAGRLWVMGDHRAASADSREHIGDPGGGTVPENKVIGRAFVIIWPVGHWAWLSNPATFDQPALNSASARPAAAPGLSRALSSPLAAGVVGAAPLVLGRRRLRRRRSAQQTPRR